MSMTGYEETSFKSRAVTETLRYSPELSAVNYPSMVSRKRNIHEMQNLVNYTSDEGGYRKEIRTQTAHNIIQVSFIIQNLAFLQHIKEVC